MTIFSTLAAFAPAMADALVLTLVFLIAAIVLFGPRHRVPSPHYRPVYLRVPRDPGARRPQARRDGDR